MTSNAALTSRRAFVAGATAAASLAAIGASAAMADTAADSWDEEYDVVVAGAGLAGTSCAVTVATEGNGEKILLIDKGEDGPQGHSALSLGVAHRTEDPDTFATYVAALLGEHTTTPEAVIKAYAQGCAEHVSWVESLGADMSTAYLPDPTERNAEGYGGEYPELPGWEAATWFGLGVADELGRGEDLHTEPDDGGAPHLGQFMLAKCQELSDSITYRTATALTALVQDPETKEILGAVTSDGKRIRAKKGVLVAVGGFVDNPKLMEDYLNAGAVMPAAKCLDEGDGIGICQKVGVDFWHMSSCGMWMAPCILDKSVYTGNPHNVFSPKQYGITVGSNGRRFYMDWDGYRCGDVVSQAGGELDLVSAYRHGRTSFGGEFKRLSFPSQAWFVFDQAGLDAGALANYTADEIEPEGVGYRADTLEELAEKMGVPADELAETVETWNQFCDEGRDRAFFRPVDSLHKIEQAPYFAQLCIPCTTNTFGGPRHDEAGRILNFEGEPIPGLYGAGEFGSIFDGLYNGGGNISECMVFGRNSARDMIANR